MTTTRNPDALTDIVARAKEKLPHSHNRIDKAVDIIRHDGVTLWPDGSASVLSQTKPDVSYTVNGSCNCTDFMTAPHHLCKHKLSATIAKRLAVQEQSSAPDPGGEALPVLLS